MLPIHCGHSSQQISRHSIPLAGSGSPHSAISAFRPCGAPAARHGAYGDQRPSISPVLGALSSVCQVGIMGTPCLIPVARGCPGIKGTPSLIGSSSIQMDFRGLLPRGRGLALYSMLATLYLAHHGTQPGGMRGNCGAGRELGNVRYGS